jgi:hypothetical protein
MTSSNPYPFQREADQIQELIEQSCGDSDSFVFSLYESKIPHISFSQVYSFETCQHQYYMRYILGKEIFPVPEYFVKGKALHRTIAKAFRTIQQGSDFDEEIIQYEGICRSSQAGIHLYNGYLTFCQNMLPSIEVVAIEKPFVFLLNNDIPPIVGIIDLILRRGDTLILLIIKQDTIFTNRIYCKWQSIKNMCVQPGFRGNANFIMTIIAG